MTGDDLGAAFDRAARESVVVVDHPVEAFVVTGPDRTSWLQGLVTCDVTSVDGTRGAWGLQLGRTGKIVSSVDVLSSGKELFVGAAPGSGRGLGALLTDHLIMEDVELAPAGADRVWLAVHGPRARAALDAARAAGAVAVGEIDWTGLGGGAIVSSAGDAATVRTAVVGAGAVLGTAADRERLRIERFVPLWGRDYDAATIPHEAALERRAVSWTKGCYLGQEVVCTLDMRGKARRTLVHLDVEPGAVPGDGALVLADEAEVGRVTSATGSTVYGRPVAIARVVAKAVHAGAPLRVGAARASVVVAPR